MLVCGIVVRGIKVESPNESPNKMAYPLFEWPKWPGQMTKARSSLDGVLYILPRGSEVDRVLNVDRAVELLVSSKAYEPMEIPELPRKFAKVRTEDDAVEFANKWGPLGFAGQLLPYGDAMWRRVDILALAGQGPHGDAIWSSADLFALSTVPLLMLGEPVSRWLEEAAWMRCALDAWDGIEIGDYRAARALLQYWPRTKARQSRGVESDRRATSLRRLRDFINMRLVGATQSRLVANSEGESELLPVPVNLRGCLWLQLSRIVARESDIRFCKGCGEWKNFAGKRPHAIFHSDNCAAAYLMRQRRANARQQSKEAKRRA